jgi:hypothetical protein
MTTFPAVLVYSLVESLIWNLEREEDIFQDVDRREGGEEE